MKTEEGLSNIITYWFMDQNYTENNLVYPLRSQETGLKEIGNIYTLKRMDKSNTCFVFVKISHSDKCVFLTEP